MACIVTSLLSSDTGNYFLGALVKLRKATVGLVTLSFRMEQLGSHRTDFLEISHLRGFLQCVENIQVYLNSDESKGYFKSITMYICDLSNSILLKMRNILDKICRENQNMHFKFNELSSHCAVYNIMWKNTVQSNRTQMTI